MRPRRVTCLLATAVTTAALAVATTTGSATAAPGGPGADPAAPAAARDGAVTEYVVLYKTASSDAGARAAIARSGGRVVVENVGVGYAVVQSTRADFADRVNASGAVAGTARDRIVGKTSPFTGKDRDVVEKVSTDRGPSVRERVVADAADTNTALPVAKAGSPTSPEPLASLQWDMRRIGATPTGSYATEPGKPGVRVGVIDTGIDGTHPDIKPNFDAGLSHNFTVDMPVIDGPCEVETCVDPSNVDDDGHGTHVASTIASPANGLGIAGVAPKATLVNLRAGQDSGYFFLQATLEALTYAGDIGVDVVNMSFYTDPWLYNCLDNPADSPAERSEQRVVRTATQRAVDYARAHGVLPVAALGNEATDLGNPTFDDSSPDFPAGAAHPREVDNSCLNVPTETGGVLSVSSLGPSGRKAYYSNYGTEQTDLSAPGGDAYDTPDSRRNIAGAVLAAYPLHLAQSSGVLNPDGTPNTPSVVRDCRESVCAYYQYLQGTSMAAPHAVGVAALVVSHYGTKDRVHGGLTLPPATTESIMASTATKTACPSPRAYRYTLVTTTGAVVTYDATCAGPTTKNGFYGRGEINANRAVTSGSV
ncbi:S8 family peptidase [Jatrophihabitans sp. YIM 134969]